MNNLNISIIGNQIFLEIMKELKLFSKYNVEFYDNFETFAEKINSNKHLLILFINEKNSQNFDKIKLNNFPVIIIGSQLSKNNKFFGEFIDKLNMPFSILDLQKKIIALFARYEFFQSSLINLRGYIINRNERKIKKNNLELQLTEKEINFLILFSQNNKPLSRNFVLKNVWKYSTESNTHTVETHIHRLRKKISEKFDDNNFIKNNKEGYYI